MNTNTLLPEGDLEFELILQLKFVDGGDEKSQGQSPTPQQRSSLGAMHRKPDNLLKKARNTDPNG